MAAADSHNPTSHMTDRWCPACRYHLKGLIDASHITCPECGGQFERDELLRNLDSVGGRLEQAAFSAGRLVTIAMLLLIVTVLALLVVSAVGRLLWDMFS